jgi:hypothetical protein
MAEAMTPNPYALQMKALEDLKSAQEQDELDQKEFQRQRTLANLFNNVGQAFQRTPVTQAEIMSGQRPQDRYQGYAQNAMKSWDSIGQDQSEATKNILNKYRLIQEQANVLRDQQAADISAQKFLMDQLAAEKKQQFEVNKLGLEHKYRMDETRAKLKDTAEKEKKPTSAQFTAATFAKRLEDSEKVFEDLAAKGYDRSSRVEDLKYKFLPGESHGSDLRSHSQAERNFVNAVLRKESGAAISPSEFASAEQQYFPRPGDTPEVLEQKRQNRLTVTAGLKAEAATAGDRLNEQLAGMPNKASQLKKPTPPDGTAVAAPQYIRRVAPNGRVVLYDQNKNPVGYEDEMGK